MGLLVVQGARVVRVLFVIQVIHVGWGNLPGEECTIYRALGTAMQALEVQAAVRLSAVALSPVDDAELMIPSEQERASYLEEFQCVVLSAPDLETMASPYGFELAVYS